MKGHEGLEGEFVVRCLEKMIGYIDRNEKQDATEERRHKPSKDTCRLCGVDRPALRDRLVSLDIQRRHVRDELRELVAVFKGHLRPDPSLYRDLSSVNLMAGDESYLSELAADCVGLWATAADYAEAVTTEARTERGRGIKVGRRLQVMLAGADSRTIGKWLLERRRNTHLKVSEYRISAVQAES